MLAKSRIDPVSVECAGSRVPIPLLELLQGKDIMVSVIDVATNHIESSEEVATTIYDAMCYVLADHIIPCTNCGMVPLSRDVARDKLHALANGVALVRAELGKA